MKHLLLMMAVLFFGASLQEQEETATYARAAAGSKGADGFAYAKR